METTQVGPPTLPSKEQMFRCGHSRKAGHRARQAKALREEKARQVARQAMAFGLGVPENADRRRQYALA